MKAWFSQRNLPMTLVVAGIGLNLIDVLTGTAATGGRLYGPQGILRGANDALPRITVPGTRGLSATYPEGLPLGLGGYLIVIGLVWMLVRRM